MRVSYGAGSARAVACAGVLLLAASSASAEALSIEVPGPIDRQAVGYACSDGSAPKVAYYNLPGQSLAVVEVEPGQPRVYVSVLAASGAKYVSGPFVFWTRGSRADMLDERQADKPAVTCRVTR